MKIAIRLTYLCLLLTGILSASTTMACTTDAWDGGISGSPVAGSPAPVSRVSGLCAMQLSAAGSVKDTKPTAEPTAIIRFYVFAQLTGGTPVIFEAFSDEGATASLLTVSFDGTNFVFDTGAGNSGNVPGKAGWNLVELAWTGGDTMDYWVNADSLSEAATGSMSASAGTMESVILGTSDSYTGTLTFDDYESHRNNPVGALLIGDSDNDGNVALADAVGVLKEARIFNSELQVGTPDCNLDGSITLNDAVRILQASRIFNAIPCG